MVVTKPFRIQELLHEMDDLVRRIRSDDWSYFLDQQVIPG